MLISRRLVPIVCVTGLVCSLLLVPPGHAQEAAADSLAADLDTDAPLSSKILPPAPPEGEEGDGIALQADALLTSHYMAQGLDSSFDHQVAQSALTATRGGLAVMVWNNYDLHDRGVNEVDVACGYTHGVGPAALTVGYQHMRYPHRDGAVHCHEMTFNAAVDAPLSPALNVHYDFDRGDGYYLTGSVSRALAFGTTLNGQIYYQKNYFDLSGWTAGALGLGYTASFGNLSVKPALTYYHGIASGDFQGEATAPNRWVLGLGITSRL